MSLSMELNRYKTESFALQKSRNMVLFHSFLGAKILILLGAGSSVPFGIPDMRKFVDMFKESLRNDDEAFSMRELVEWIELALNDSQRLVGTKIQFDLESLIVVLQDLVATMDKPISAPTFAFMLHLLSQKQKEIGTYNIENVRATFGKRAEALLNSLRLFIFDLCMKPIEIGQKELTGFSFLDLFYGPLFILLGNTDLRSPTTKWVFTTNWDLCLKQWLEYASAYVHEFEDGVTLDNQRKPVLSTSQGWSVSSQKRKVVPLHGSFDLIKKRRVVSGGFYEDIHKVTAPEIYFKGNTSEIAKAFMIFPLEAVGYEQSVRSPYIDMLNLLKEVLRQENLIFVIGFSFRDPTVASIFEEVLRERAERGDWQPIGGKPNLENISIDRLKEMRLKVFLIDSSPQTVIDNLIRHGYENTGRALIPIDVSFPDMMIHSEKDLAVVTKEVEKVISLIHNKLYAFGVVLAANHINNALRRYDLSIMPEIAQNNQT